MKLNHSPAAKKWGVIVLSLLSVCLTGWYLLATGYEFPVAELSSESDEVSAPVDAGPPPPLQHVVQKGDSLFDILSASGVSAVQIDQLVKASRSVYNLTALAAGNSLKIWLTPEENPSLIRLQYEIDPLNELEVTAEDGAFTARKATHDIEVRYERAEGTITSSLYASAVGAGLSPEIVMGLTDIFAWDINFFTDIREGDSYTILYERQYVKDTFRGYGKILAARFLNQGEERIAIHYGKGGYYDAEGRPIQKLFLKAPLNYRRISSGFSRSRKHPIFQVARPHLGIDYAAPSGTPVVALGPGTVTLKGWSGGFGKSVRISHPAGYVTYYGHLSGYAKGLGKGSKVRQGQVIGYVGSTGLSTGPHLDFRVTLQGKFINPLALKPVNSPPLHGEALAAFKQFSREKLALLDDASISGTVKYSPAAPQREHPAPLTMAAAVSRP